MEWLFIVNKTRMYKEVQRQNAAFFIYSILARLQIPIKQQSVFSITALKNIKKFKLNLLPNLGGRQSAVAAAGKLADEISRNKPTEKIWGPFKVNKMLTCPAGLRGCWRQHQKPSKPTQQISLSFCLNIVSPEALMCFKYHQISSNTGSMTVASRFII